MTSHRDNYGGFSQKMHKVKFKTTKLLALRKKVSNGRYNKTVDYIFDRNPSAETFTDIQKEAFDIWKIAPAFASLQALIKAEVQKY